MSVAIWGVMMGALAAIHPGQDHREIHREHRDREADRHDRVTIKFPRAQSQQ